MKPRSLGASVLALAASVLSGTPSNASDQSPKTVMKLNYRRSYSPPLRFSTFRPNPLSQRPPYNQRKSRKARRARHAHGDRKAFL